MKELVDKIYRTLENKKQLNAQLQKEKEDLDIQLIVKAIMEGLNKCYEKIANENVSEYKDDHLIASFTPYNWHSSKNVRLEFEYFEELVNYALKSMEPDIGFNFGVFYTINDYEENYDEYGDDPEPEIIDHYNIMLRNKRENN